MRTIGQLSAPKARCTFFISEDRFPTNLYYGKNSPTVSLDKFDPPFFSFSPNYAGKHYQPDTAALEFPFFGSGDFRACALKLRDLSCGSDITDFVYKKLRKFRGRIDLPGLPCGDADDKTETLELTMEDKVTGCILKLYYTVFADIDVISRYFVLENGGKFDTLTDDGSPRCAKMLHLVRG